MPKVEYVTMANHAEAVNGLLYLSGAGWTEHWRTPPAEGPPPASYVGIGVSILVAWGETNRRHRLTLRVEGEDGATELYRLEADLEVGRPPGVPPGIDLRSVLAANLPLVFPQEGGYRVVAQIGNEGQTTSFRVHDQPPPGLLPAGL